MTPDFVTSHPSYTARMGTNQDHYFEAVEIVESEEDILARFGKVPQRGPMYATIKPWQRALVDMKEEAGLSTQEIADYSGATKSVVNTTLYTAEAPERQDVVQAVKALFALSKQPEEKAIREFLAGDMFMVVMHWAVMSGFFTEMESIVDTRGRMKRTVFTVLAGYIGVDLMTISRWVNSVQKPKPYNLRRYHRMMMQHFPQAPGLPVTGKPLPGGKR